MTSLLEAISPTARFVLGSNAGRPEIIDEIMRRTGAMIRPDRHRHYLEGLADFELFTRLETLKQEKKDRR